MAKKTKRKVSQSSVINTSPGESTRPIVEASPTRSTFSRRTVSPAAEFNPDYTYVINDLKRIGILAGTFFAVLIVLSFIIK